MRITCAAMTLAFVSSSPAIAGYRCVDDHARVVAPEKCGGAASSSASSKKRAPPTESLAAIPTPAAATTTPKETNKPTETKWFLRRNFEDLGSFAEPNALADSAGAELSWLRDGVKSNQTWAAQGLIGVRFLRSEFPNYPYYVSSQTLGLYAQFDRTSNSNPLLKSKNTDDLTLGLVHETALDTAQATHYFRAKGEIVSDFEGRTKNWNAALEYQPYGNPSQDVPNTIFSYLGTPLPFGNNFFLTISPKLKAEYRGSLDGSEDPIFFKHEQAFRTGPTVTASLDGAKFANVPLFFQRMHIAATYGYLYDWVSGRDYRLLDASITENLDAANLFGLTFSYRRGQLETTGANVDIFKISLSGKFGEDAK